MVAFKGIFFSLLGFIAVKLIVTLVKALTNIRKRKIIGILLDPNDSRIVIITKTQVQFYTVFFGTAAALRCNLLGQKFFFVSRPDKATLKVEFKIEGDNYYTTISSPCKLFDTFTVKFCKDTPESHLIKDGTVLYLKGQ